MALGNISLKVALAVAIVIFIPAWCCMGIFAAINYSFGLTWGAGLAITIIMCCVCCWCIPAWIRMVILLVRKDGADDKSLRNVVALCESGWMVCICYCAFLVCCASIVVAVFVLVRAHDHNKPWAVAPFTAGAFFLMIVCSAAWALFAAVQEWAVGPDGSYGLTGITGGDTVLKA